MERSELHKSETPSKRLFEWVRQRQRAVSTLRRRVPTI
ncbi:hypothetical protein MCP1_160072 [Candidatus Terasakiella magnetica]|nr:hypothetical protein MCP1_160072 [Candidatus Terasakiella magnetica]